MANDTHAGREILLDVISFPFDLFLGLHNRTTESQFRKLDYLNEAD